MANKYLAEYKVEIYEDASGEYRWRLTHDNGRIVADSGEGYKNRADCEAEAFKVFPSEVDPLRPQGDVHDYPGE